MCGLPFLEVSHFCATQMCTESTRSCIVVVYRFGIVESLLYICNEQLKIFKELLGKCVINAKWYNINSWVNIESKNLLELCENERIKIRKSGTQYKITYNYGQMRVIRYSTFSSLERDIVNLYAQQCLYLGDKFVIKHRLRNYSN